MTPDFIMRLAGQAIVVVMKASAPMLLVGLVVGLIVSIFQAATQIQEQTLAFVPKIVAVLLAIVFFGPWIIHTLYDFTFNLFSRLSEYIS